MSATLDPAAAVLREFGLYYLADELPHPLDENLPANYAATARRLKAAVGEQGVAPLVALLRAMRDGPSHPTVRAIEDDTWFEWTERLDTWTAFRQLMDGIVAELQPR